RPVATATCASDPSPRTTRRFQVSNGVDTYHPTPIDGRYTTPRPDHTYTYAVPGANKKVGFQELDSPVYDNYGEFRISTRQAYAPDCAGRAWHNFLYADGLQAFI